MAETTQADVVAAIQRRYGLYSAGTAAPTSSASTIVSTDLIEPDNAFRGSYVRLTGGAYSGSERMVTAYAVGRLTCNPFAGAVVSGDTASQVAGKIRTALAADADVSDFFNVSGSGADVVLTAKVAAANDATMNIAIANGTCAGLTDDATSADTTAGVAGVTAQVETATVVGGITQSGNVTVTVTAAGAPALVSGKAISVAVVYTGATFTVGPLTNADVVAAIREAIRSAGNTWMSIQVDESSVAFSDAEQMYDLPADLVALLSVDIDYDSEMGFHQWRPFGSYDLIGPPGERQLRLRDFVVDQTITNPTTYDVRLQYLALVGRMAASTDVLGIGEASEDDALAFIIEYALHILHEQAFSRNRLADDARAHLTAAQSHLMKAEAVRSRTRIPAHTRRYAVVKLPRHI